MLFTRLSFYAFLGITLGLSLVSTLAGTVEKEPVYMGAKPSMFFAERLPAPKKLPFVPNAWVDSVYETMSDTARLGQLFMVAAFSTTDKPDVKLLQLIEQYQLGGLIFMKGSPVRQAQLTNTYQAAAKVPLMVAMDAEWGLSMRLDSTVKYPYQMTLGAIEDNQLIYEMGKQIAQQCRRLGVHISFSPVVDVNNNPNNPVIGFRAFGENKQDVAHKGVAYMKGLQDHGVLACAKHFPGHGDTDVDSHYGLPVVKASKRQLDTLELLPFKHLIREGVGSVMVAHLAIPSLDDTKNQASTLSPKVVSKLLKEELSFEGLVFTDALNMKGVADFYPPGEVDAQALLAGNDVLLYSMDVPTAINRIFLALAEGRLKWHDIEKRVKRILAAKYWFGLNQYQPVELENLYNDLHPTAAGALNQRIFEQAITLVRNDHKLLPLRGRSTARRLHLGIGEPTALDFYNALGIYGSMEHRYLPMKADSLLLQALAAELANYNEIIVSWHLSTQRAGQKFGIEPAMVAAIKALLQDKKSVQVVFGNAYALPQFDFGTALVCGFEEHPWAYKNAAQQLFGAMPFKGKLPVSVSKTLKAGTGLSSSASWNLRLVDPSQYGYEKTSWQRIDSIMELAMRLGATPGAQVLAAKGGNIFFYKQYGHTDWSQQQSVSQATVYDLASLTKVLATGIGLMQRYDQNQLPIDSSLGFFLPELKGAELGNRTLRQLMAHQAGLPAFVPYWKKTFKQQQPDPWWWDTEKAPIHSNTAWLEVAEGRHIRTEIRDSLWAWVKAAPLNPAGQYVYSDLGLHLLWRLLERHWQQSPDQWLEQNWYAPAGTTSLGYQPRQRLPLALIAPTENDTDFRRQLLQGHVHDQTAALLGGVAGHAGLFSNAADILRVLQPLLGTSDFPQPVLKPYTVDLFSSPQFVGNRRGLLWDRQSYNGQLPSPVGPSPSNISFGHSGFTGTLVWIDPQIDLVYIFLSNRVHPSVNPNRLAELNVRTQVLEVFYK
jgi:beta-glucosidase-like glycosyl hydrolase/CubicO group peptidase (beta-lactamase class C family)